MKDVLVYLLCLSLVLVVFPGAVQAEVDTLFTERDLTQEADLTEAETIILAGQSVTIDHAGVFVLSGSIENGQVLVEAGEEDKVQLVLDGVTIHAETGAAIEVKTADKVFITLAQGSENSLSSEKIDEDEADGVVYSKADLTLNGLGSLTVTAATGKGIVCKDTLAITGGIYSIQAAGHGISGKDALNIADGSFTITTGGGSQAVEMKASDNFGTRGAFPGGFNGRNMSADMTPPDGFGRQAAPSANMGGENMAADMMPPDGFGRQDAPMANTNTQAASQDEETVVKAKGLKSDGPITVLAGSFTLDCADDAVHAGSDITISGGQWQIRTADDGIHSDEHVIIGGGSFDIPYCYEGIEGKNVTISGGTIQITATDDGINAAGEDSETGHRIPGVDNGAVITVDGGEITIVSDGDCLDSNGSIVLNGGTLKLTCNGNGNTALDSESGVTNNGADVTTNDGSENSTGFGGRGGRGQMGGDPGQFGGKDKMGGGSNSQNRQ